VGHSIQLFSGKFATVEDSGLIVIIIFASKFVRQSPKFYQLRDIVKGWEDSLEGYGPGVIDLKLEQLDRCPELVEKLEELLAAILVDASQYGEKIPSGMLNGQHTAPGVSFYDYDITYLKRAIGRLHSLISEK
jgi:hypothetical protein